MYIYIYTYKRVYCYILPPRHPQPPPVSRSPVAPAQAAAAAGRLGGCHRHLRHAAAWYATTTRHSSALV